MPVALVYFLVRKFRSLKVKTGREIEKEKQREWGEREREKKKTEGERERGRVRLTPREAQSE